MPVFIFHAVFNFCDSNSYFLYFYYFIVVLFLILLLPSPHYDLKTSFFKFSFVCYSFLFSIIFAQFVLFSVWILSNNVFEEIVGESIHQDLVSKSAIILVFLGHRRALTEKHIDALWLATKKAHEAVVRVLHQVNT